MDLNQPRVNITYGEKPVPQNWISELVAETKYPPLPMVDRKYKAFGPAPVQANATAFYRSMMPAIVLRNYYGVMDYISGFEIAQDADLWTRYINASEILVIEREFNDNIVPGVKRYKSLNGPVLFDLDDHIHQFKSMKIFHSKTEKQINEFWDEEVLESFNNVVAECDAVITTTQSLANYYKTVHNKRAFCIRNAIDSISTRWNFNFEKMDSRDFIVFGFMGGSTHGADLDILEPVVREVLDTCPNVKFKFIGYTPKWLFDLFDDGYRKRVLTDFGFTKLDKYPEKMYNIDVGLAPLANNEFNRIGKSDLKYLEYTMAGAATVASKIGQYKESIKNKQNGLLVDNTTEDWVRVLTRLAQNPQEIIKIQKAAVEDVLKNRTIITEAREWYNVMISERKRWESKPTVILTKEI